MQASLSPNRTNVPIGLMALILLAVFAALTLPLVVDFATSHGVAKHGSSALAIRECLSKSGPMQTWVNPDTGRRAHVCEISPGVFGIQIIKPGTDGSWQEVTAFVKSKFTRLGQVMQYLTNTGYYVIH